MKRFWAVGTVLLAILTQVAVAQRVPLPYPWVEFYTNAGKPCSGCRLWTYVTGTTTPLSTYTSATGAANTNPVILDTAGRASVWIGDRAYKLILEDSSCAYRDVYGTCHGQLIRTVDNVQDYGLEAITGSALLIGDVSGTLITNSVDKIKGYAVATNTPADNNILIWNDPASQYEPGTFIQKINSLTALNQYLVATDTGTDFTITSTTDTHTFTLPTAARGVSRGLVTDQAQLFGGGKSIYPLQILDDGGSLRTDASTSNNFRVFLSADAETLENPTNPIDGQRVTWWLHQDVAGNRVLTLGTDFVTGPFTVVCSTASSAIDILEAVYYDYTKKWYVVAFNKGYVP